MTRKDYVQFAKVFKMARIMAQDSDADTVVEYIQDQIESVLKSDNPRFDKVRFRITSTPA